MNRCVNCSSMAINLHAHGRERKRPDLCDVCYWRDRAECAEARQSYRDARDREARLRADNEELRKVLRVALAALEAR